MQQASLAAGSSGDAWTASLLYVLATAAATGGVPTTRLPTPTACPVVLGCRQLAAPDGCCHLAPISYRSNSSDDIIKNQVWEECLCN